MMFAWLWRRQVLEEAQDRLQKVVRERLEKARGRRDHATILRFTRLFPLLGMPVPPCCRPTKNQHYMTPHGCGFAGKRRKSQTAHH